MDHSASLQEAHKQASNDVIQMPQDQKEEISIIIPMKPVQYQAAAGGNIDYFNKNEEDLERLLTCKKNTVLHIFITSRVTDNEGETCRFVEEMVWKCSKVLKQPNEKGETPLHIAARYGHGFIVKKLIQLAKDVESGVGAASRVLLEMANQDKDTALHEAVRFEHYNVVEILIDEDPDLAYSGNVAGETPLYMAAERGYGEIMFKILDKCKSPATDGPNGRNVLPAATIRKDGEMIEKILRKKKPLMEQADDVGWTPLHYAASTGYLDAIDKFIEFGGDVAAAAYIQDNKDGYTALHLAALNGHTKIMLKILEWRPDCFEIVNNRGWNILHCALHAKKFEGTVNSILKNSALRNLINEKDTDGNTPLHHIAMSLNLTQAEQLFDIHDLRLDKMAFNKENKNALDIASTSKRVALMKKCVEGRLQTEGLISELRLHKPINTVGEKENEMDGHGSFVASEMDKVKEANLIVATLIATVTFTVGFTAPGGYVSEEGPLKGTPILGKSPAFAVFMIMDAIAMVLSSCAVFLHLFLSLKQDITRTAWYLFTAFFLTTFAMGAMVVAFVTGTYAVLGYSTWLAVVTSVIGSSFFLVFYQLFKKTFLKNFIGN